MLGSRDRSGGEEEAALEGLLGQLRQEEALLKATGWASSEMPLFGVLISSDCIRLLCGRSTSRARQRP